MGLSRPTQTHFLVAGRLPAHSLLDRGALRRGKARRPEREANLDGQAIDTLKKEINAFEIGRFSRDGDSKEWGSAGRRFVSFDLQGTRPWPRTYGAQVTAAELDNNSDFIEFLRALWELLEPKVMEIVGAALAAAAGGALGAIVGTEIAPIIGTIVGAIIGAVIGWFVGFVFDSMRDDIMTSADLPLMVLLPSPSDVFQETGGPRTLVRQAEYTLPEIGTGATYSITTGS